MGYRSDVGIAFTEKGAKQFYDNLSKIEDEDTQEMVAYLLENAPIHEIAENGEELYIFNDIKWYVLTPDCEDITEVDKAIRNVDSKEHLFIRIGESADDLETDGEYWDNPFELGYRRELTFNIEVGEEYYGDVV